MNKRRIISMLIFCFVGIMLVNGVSAVQPYKHHTYGDAMAGFLANGAYGVEFRGLGLDYMANLPAVVTTTQKIEVWWAPPWDYCVEDAHYISVGVSFWQSDIDFLGASFKDFYLAWDMINIDYILDGEFCEGIKTPLKPARFQEYIVEEPVEILPGVWIPAGYVDSAIWWFQEGMIFKPGALSVGIHSLTVIIEGWFPWPWAFDMEFEINACWH
ncbi:MAG: hypothetical protein KAU62_10895 [Candidatus Heimdallarchaeota archaeon]|nr:hypothetical protein [Candidatus Heimdallarchaeota archaeon]MCG3256588.1 hypothetical protein [Candidatus Heimdallarchaeota archaeon]MCK4611652.1 hypothetical protein [Candidatus Heimdallarchaeota archaeon]